MKKSFPSAAVILIAIFTVSLSGFSQTMRIEPYVFPCLDQSGLARHDIGVGGDITFGILEDYISLGASMSGGMVFPYQTMVKTSDMKRDTLVWKRTNAPALQGILAVNIPKGDNEERINPFYGKVAGIKYGISNPDLNIGMANTFTAFLQLNYTKQMGTDENKWYLGGFIQPAFNYLSASIPNNSSPRWVATLNCGISVGFSFSGE